MRSWPRGISKDRVDLWMKGLGTDKELVKKWKDRKITWEKFAVEYKKSLKGKEYLLDDLAKESKRGTITLLCSDRDPYYCHRSLLRAAVEARPHQSP